MAQNKEVLVDYRRGCAAPETSCQATSWRDHSISGTMILAALSFTGSPPAVTGGNTRGLPWVES
jgi:hypothetical protein